MPVARLLSRARTSQRRVRDDAIASANASRAKLSVRKRGSISPVRPDRLMDGLYRTLGCNNRVTERKDMMLGLTCLSSAPRIGDMRVNRLRESVADTGVYYSLRP